MPLGEELENLWNYPFHQLDSLSSYHPYRWEHCAAVQRQGPVHQGSDYGHSCLQRHGETIPSCQHFSVFNILQLLHIDFFRLFESYIKSEF